MNIKIFVTLIIACFLPGQVIPQSDNVEFMPSMASGHDRDQITFELMNKSGHDIWIYILSNGEPVFSSPVHMTGRTFAKKKFKTIQTNIDIDRSNVLYLWTANPGMVQVTKTGQILPDYDYRFIFEPYKKLFLTYDDRDKTKKKRLSKKRNILYPQTGKHNGAIKISESKESLHNNVRVDDIKE